MRGQSGRGKAGCAGTARSAIANDAGLAATGRRFQRAGAKTVALEQSNLIRDLMKRIPLGFAVLALAGLFHAPVTLAQGTGGSADSARGKISMCIGCHGIAMYKTVYPEVYAVPMIAGQNSQYIVKALQAYRGGERKHPSMTGVARSLSDQDMADIASYYGGGGK
jgi:cytochrome c553